MITVCVPVYQAAAFVEETLVSLRAQTFTDFHVVMSIDASTDGSSTICRGFLDDPRFELHEQSSRLGWIDNCNWLVSRVRTPYFCILPHDDVLHPDYLGRMRAELEAHSSAVAAYSDIVTFGPLGGHPLTQASIQGEPFVRIMTFLVQHFAAVAFRGVIRTGAAPPGFQHNTVGGFAADTVWLMRLLRHGDFIRVPQPLYRKRLDVTCTHAEWYYCSAERKAEAWLGHCLELAPLALDVAEDDRQGVHILHALVRRFLGGHGQFAAFVDSWGLPPERQDVLVDVFLEALGDVVDRERLKRLVDLWPPYPGRARRAARGGAEIRSRVSSGDGHTSACDPSRVTRHAQREVIP